MPKSKEPMGRKTKEVIILIVNNRLPQSYLKTLGRKDCFMNITALSGEFPYYSFERLGISTDYAKILRHRLSQEEMIQTVHANNLKGIILTKKAVDYFREQNSKRYKYISDRNRTELNRRFRKQLFALTYCSLVNADIEFLADKKPFIFARSRNQSYSVATPLLITSLLDDKPVFYSSVEIKYELEDYVQQIRNSAMMGLILSNDGCFILYNLDDNRVPLSYATEMKVSVLTTGDGNFIKQSKNSNAIFFVKDFKIAESLILGNKTEKKSPSKVILNEVYRRICIIPETTEGDLQLRVLCHKDFRQIIEDAFCEAFGKPNSNYKIINDGFDKAKNPVINSCFLDVVKLLKFKRGLLTNNIVGRILCFDFQTEFISKIMHPAKIHLNHIEIQDVKEMMNDC